jgi:hypothetical protein
VGFWLTYTARQPVQRQRSVVEIPNNHPDLTVGMDAGGRSGTTCPGPALVRGYRGAGGQSRH